MKISLSTKTFLLSALLTGAQCVSANVVTTLGEQDFQDGQLVASGTFLNARGTAANPSINEPDPFNLLIGADNSVGPNFSANWTFSYSPIQVATVADGNFTLGIVDHESTATGNQVASFLMRSGANVIDLTGSLNGLFESRGGGSREYNVYSLTLPFSASMSQILASGTVTFSLTLQGPGLNIDGETPFNFAGVDFSTLTVNTLAPVPLPAAGSLFLFGVSALFAVRRKKVA
ncbi:MAG: hypothetical protein HOP02_02835 [Methylococcaceae bacterium]|nr:hypothetical protein [Methylococcaceae bacterium]